MQTTNLASIPARLVFSRPEAVDAKTFNATRGRRNAIAYLGLFNNSRVLAWDGSWVLVHATSFAASGFNRAGFQVWQVIGEPEHWLVYTSRIGVRVV